jgi:hypothetical protein
MKKKIVLILFVIAFIGVKAQVNLQQGSAEFTLPITTYKDNASRITLNMALSYSSRGGVVVDQLPSAIGQGWNIDGGGVITRIQKGLPDDQKEQPGAIYDINRFSAGYLYNNIPITQGCPKSLNLYPIFEYPNRIYKDLNYTISDREQDYFIFNFNGRIGKFVIGKNNEIKVLNDSKLKIIPEFDNVTFNFCRTTINKFVITDETGIQFVFSQRSYSKIYNYYSENSFWANINWPSGIGGLNGMYEPTAIEFGIPKIDVNTAHEISNNFNPYVTNSWYLSKILDPRTSRNIRFEYNTEIIDMNGALSTSSSHSDVTSNVNSQSKHDNIIVTKEKIYEEKPVISKVIFPDENSISFIYSDLRKDCYGSHKLSEIKLNSTISGTLLTLKLEQSYFVKNQIKEPTKSEEPWSRLCLLSIKKVTELGPQNFLDFDYYKGSNNIEDFVPPIFFHAKDPWGYYNGNYCGVPVNQMMDNGNLFNVVINGTQANPGDPNWHFTYLTPCNAQILSTYNSPNVINSYLNETSTSPIAYYMRSNSKTLYARNGLLKTIINEYGGTTNFEYEQNKFNEIITPNLESYFHSSLHSIESDVVGGVHISKVITKESISSSSETTEYKFINSDGTSSLWGIEFPSNIEFKNQYFENEYRYFDASNLACDYHFKFPGIAPYQTSSSIANNSEIAKVLSQIYRYYQIANSLYQMISNSDFKDVNLFTSFVQFVIGIISSCTGTNPKQTSATFIHHNNALNFLNPLPSQFKRVEIFKYSSTGQMEGNIIKEFTSPKDFPIIISKNYFPYVNGLRAYDWAYGLLKSIKKMDNSGKLANSEEFDYQLIENKFSDINTLSCNCYTTYLKSERNTDWEGEINNYTINSIYGGNTNYADLNVEFYNQSAGRTQLLKSTESIYNSSGDKINSITFSSYNSKNFLLSSSKTVDSKGYAIEKKIYYPEDYSPISNPIFQGLFVNNIVSIPVSTETWQIKPGSTIPELLSTSITEFGLTTNGDYKPTKTYGLQTDKPIPQNIIGVFDPNKLVRNPPGQSLIIPTTEINYDAAGNIVQVKDIQGNRYGSTIYGYNNSIPIATVNNAGINEIAYTSFERNDANYNNVSWNWVNGNSGLLYSNSPTGNYCSYPFVSISSDVITNKNKEYKLSFWANSGNFTVSTTDLVNPVLVTQKISSPTINGWTYYEYDIAPTSAYCAITIKASGSNLDELRLYPKNATMATTTYNPGIGKTSECDINNRITYYEYDGLGRITKVMDENRNIIKTYEYHFKN